MATPKLSERGRIYGVLEKYGRCVELVPLDPNFHDISVGLYVKDGIGTVWTFSRRPGVEARIEKIRDQLVSLGGLEPIEGTHDQARAACGQIHNRPLKFLMMRAVEKSPDLTHPEGEISVKDLRSDLILKAAAEKVDGRVVYTVDADGEAKNKTARIVATTGGFVRYGEMEKVDANKVAFSCGFRHDGLMWLLISHARNVSGAQDMLDEAALRGQMTTSTLGFSRT